MAAAVSRARISGEPDRKREERLHTVVKPRWDRAELRVDARNLGDARDAVSESEFGDAQYYRMTARTVQARLIWHY